MRQSISYVTTTIVIIGIHSYGCHAFLPTVVVQHPQQQKYQKKNTILFESSTSSSETTTIQVNQVQQEEPSSGTTTTWITNEFEQQEGENTKTNTKQQQTRQNDNNKNVVVTSPTLLDLRKEAVIGPSRVVIYDTTLRDGTQGESVSASVDDKFKIVSKLNVFHVDYIEAGWPGSNPKDAEFFKRAQNELSVTEKAKLVAFGSTCRKHIHPRDDQQVTELILSNAPTICIVAKSHLWQVTDILKATPEENLRMIYDTTQYLVKDANRTVMIDLEHFFDGYKSNKDYTIQCCQSAIDAGASCLVLCDTNGGTMPWEISTICKEITSYFHSNEKQQKQQPITFGIHCHNDCGMAVANSLMAIQNGVGLIQGTINGIGERTGNADLCSIIPSLAFHVNQKNDVVEDEQNEGGSQMSCRGNLKELTSLSRYVDEILNRTPLSSAPYVGSSAFAHKGGLHVAAMERSPLSYQHIHPEYVGNKKRVLISELSGRQNILGKMKENSVVSEDMFDEKEASERAVFILKRVKDLEAKGYTFEGADASIQLMILHSTRGYCPPFQVLDYSANVYDSNMDSATRVVQQQQKQQDTGSSSLPLTTAQARATVKVRTFNPPSEDEMNIVTHSTSNGYYQDSLEVGDGNGPVDALAKALMRALLPTHPYLSSLELIDYKVRILDPESATQAATRVMIEFKDNISDLTWTTVSVDTNIISASLNALVDGFEYALIEHAESCNLCEDFF